MRTHRHTHPLQNLARLQAPQANAQRQSLPSLGDAFTPATSGLGLSALAPDGPLKASYVNTPEQQNIAPQSQFKNAVNQAIDAVQAKGIGVDPNDHEHVTDRHAYMKAIAMELRRRGYNAAIDGRAGPGEPEELIVNRPGDAFSETFRTYTSKGKVRRFYMAYQEPPGVLSSPAPRPNPNDPLAPTPLNDAPARVSAVNTPEQQHLAPESTYRDAVNRAIDFVQNQGIGVDPSDHEVVVDRHKYMDAVVRQLRSQGYQCAADGRGGPGEPEELVINRKGDDFSEAFRIYTSKGKVRRFYISYQEPPGLGAVSE